MAKLGSSQYLDEYLDEGEVRIERGLPPITPGSYLVYVLRGRAKSYSARYQDALRRALEIEEREGRVVRVRSAGGGTAWIRWRDVPRYRQIWSRAHVYAPAPEFGGE